ncbi:hypothetical protein [Bradyrhizobium sp. Ash2021]|uniref:hypothetical protein n=1 Tax=Bradyrhizobium sp. Ash2021 TaxID=2954771 RepID=UPI0028165A21|nr:hypothetical protein [Bradyrhizobium sp. Ash2021]WMT71133.1 hypothetical protein NL528_23830 [Bradyrhizobium sp. Ash2021]
MAKAGWQREFFDPIPLPNGRQLVTLMDAGEYFQSLPKAKQNATPWRNATEALLQVVDYVEPWLYRACIRAGGRLADCSDDANAHP